MTELDGTRTTRNISLRIAALTGAVLSAGVIAAGTPVGDSHMADDIRIDVVAGGFTGTGSTCCGDGPVVIGEM